MLAPAEGVDGKRRVPPRLVTTDRQARSLPGHRLGAGDWGRHVLPGKKRGAAVGYGKHGKGTKIMLLTDGEGTPLAATLAGANQAEVERIEPLVRLRVSRRKPKRLIYDLAADSDPLRKRLKTQREVDPRSWTGGGPRLESAEVGEVFLLGLRKRRFSGG
jgi:hypothetical protein